MPATIESGSDPATYKAAGWIKHHIKIGECLLLRMVATGRVRVFRTSTYPMYAIEDVRRFLKEEGREEPRDYIRKTSASA